MSILSSSGWGSIHNILVTLQSFFTFALAMFVLAITPGPGVFATVSEAITAGFRSSRAMIAGIILGDVIFLTFAILGLSAIANVLGSLFFLVRIAGSAYLIWMGWNLWRSQPAVPEKDRASVPRRNRFLAGLCITLGNPKAIIFYLSLLPTFLDLHRVTVLDYTLAVSLVASILSLVMGVYAYTAACARSLFTGSSYAAQVLNRCSGTVMIGTGVVLAFRKSG